MSMAGRAKGTRRENLLLGDIGLIFISALVAGNLAHSDAIPGLLASSSQAGLVGTLIAGMFFTSVFTTIPSIAALGELSLMQPLWITAAVGGAGAVLGDLLIFRFVKDRFAADLADLFRTRKSLPRISKLFKFRHFRWFTLLLGGLVIASPLPDELGAALMGFSRVNLKWFVATSFTFNAIGIYLIGLAARSLAA